MVRFPPQNCTIRFAPPLAAFQLVLACSLESTDMSEDIEAAEDKEEGEEDEEEEEEEKRKDQSPLRGCHTASRVTSWGGGRGVLSEA